VRIKEPGRMEQWMRVHGVRTREEWEAEQPQEQKPDKWDMWYSALPAAHDAEELDG
jgi:hypothetical protein